MNRLTAQELAQLEASIEAFPVFRAMEFASRLKEAYREIERLNGVNREWERDMNGTLAMLAAERQKASSLLVALNNLSSTARTFRDVPIEDQAWTSIDEAALEEAFSAIADAERGIP